MSFAGEGGDVKGKGERGKNESWRKVLYVWGRERADSHVIRTGGCREGPHPHHHHPQHMCTHSCPCLSFERAGELSAKWKRGDRSNVMSVVSMQLRHVSAASLVITTSHRETGVFAFICSCCPPHPSSSSFSSLGPLLWQQQSSTQEIDMYAGRKRIIGVSGLCVLVFLSLTHMFSHSALLCMKTYTTVTDVLMYMNATRHCFFFSFFLFFQLLFIFICGFSPPRGFKFIFSLTDSALGVFCKGIIVLFGYWIVVNVCIFALFVKIYYVTSVMLEDFQERLNDKQ